MILTDQMLVPSNRGAPDRRGAMALQNRRGARRARPYNRFAVNGDRGDPLRPVPVDAHIAPPEEPAKPEPPTRARVVADWKRKYVYRAPADQCATMHKKYNVLTKPELLGDPINPHWEMALLRRIVTVWVISKLAIHHSQIDVLWGSYRDEAVVNDLNHALVDADFPPVELNYVGDLLVPADAHRRPVGGPKIGRVAFCVNVYSQPDGKASTPQAFMALGYEEVIWVGHPFFDTWGRYMTATWIRDGDTISWISDGGALPYAPHNACDEMYSEISTGTHVSSVERSFNDPSGPIYMAISITMHALPQSYQRVPNIPSVKVKCDVPNISARTLTWMHQLPGSAFFLGLMTYFRPRTVQVRRAHMEKTMAWWSQRFNVVWSFRSLQRFIDEMLQEDTAYTAVLHFFPEKATGYADALLMATISQHSAEKAPFVDLMLTRLNPAAIKHNFSLRTYGVDSQPFQNGPSFSWAILGLTLGAGFALGRWFMRPASALTGFVELGTLMQQVCANNIYITIVAPIWEEAVKRAFDNEIYKFCSSMVFGYLDYYGGPHQQNYAAHFVQGLKHYFFASLPYVKGVLSHASHNLLAIAAVSQTAKPANILAASMQGVLLGGVFGIRPIFHRVVGFFNFSAGFPPEIDPTVKVVDRLIPQQLPDRPAFWRVIGHPVPMFRPQRSAQNAQAILYHRLARVVAQPFVRPFWDRLMRYMTKFTFPMIGDHSEEFEDWLAHVDPVKRRLYREAYARVTQNPLFLTDNRVKRIQMNIKTDEVLLKQEADSEYGAVPRPIHAVNVELLVTVAPSVYAASKRISEWWDYFFIFSDRVTLTYGAGRNAQYLSHWFNRAIETPGYFHVIAAGDDLAIIGHIGTSVYIIEADVSQCDHSIRGPALTFEYDVLRRLGVSRYVVDLLRANASALCAMNLPNDQGKFKVKRGPERNTGGADTTIGNTVIIGAACAYALTRDEPHQLARSMAAAGFTIKIKYQHVKASDLGIRYYPPTFLKGTWWRANLGFWVWAPLLSVYLKATKVMTDPMIMFRKHQPKDLDQACEWYWSNMAANLLTYSHDPRVAAWLNAAAARPYPRVLLHDYLYKPMGEETQSVRYDIDVVEQAANWYNVPAEWINDFIEHLIKLSPGLESDHPMWAIMAARDYG